MEDEDDVHMCLVCHRTISGLLSYVNHKKNECSGRKPAKDIHDAPFQSCVNSVNEMRNQNYALVPNSLYAQSFTPHNQQSYILSDNYARSEGSVHETVHVLNSQTGISTTLDVFDPEAQLHDICLKAYSPPTTQTASVTNGLFDTSTSISHQQSSCDLSAFALSPSIFTSASKNVAKLRETASSHQNHGLLNACISNSVEANFTTAVNIHIPSQYSILSSDKSPNPNGAAININEIISDNHSKSQASSKAATEKVDDFFQSLELMSKANPKADKGSTFNQLPISNILNNLTFSSDEEDLGFNFADDVSLDSMSDNSEDDTAPPSNYTGAKWKPGEKPGTNQYKRNRPMFRGKWPPGQVPVKTTAKYYGGRAKGGKNISSLLPSPKKKSKVTRQVKPSSKTFRCNFCDVDFDSRFKYSNHCGSTSHKEKVFGKRDEVKVTYGKGRGKSVIRKVVESPIVVKPDLPENDTPNFEEDMEAEVTEVTVKIEYDPEVQVIQADLDADVTPAVVENQEAPDEGGHIYTAVPLHICTVCDKKFPNKYIISNHLLSKYHRNRAAAQRQRDFELLQRYHKYIIRLSPYQCAICRFYFNKAKFFKQHLQSKEHIQLCEDLIGEMMCSLCQFKTHIQSVLVDHMYSKEHTLKLAKHKKLCVVKESHVECRCKYCGLVMRSFTRLKHHIQTKHHSKQIEIGVIKRQVGVRNRPKCRTCGQQFQCMASMKMHVQRIHSKKRPFKCSVCTVAFACKYDLGMHCKTSKHLQRLIDLDKQAIKRAKDTVPESVESILKQSEDMKVENKEKVNDETKEDSASEEKKAECNSINTDFIKKEVAVQDNIETAKQPSLDVDQLCHADKADQQPEKVADKLDKADPHSEKVADVYGGITDTEDVDIMLDLADTEDEWTPGTKKVHKPLKRAVKKYRKKKEPTIKQQTKESKPSLKKKGKPVKIYKCDHCSFTATSYNGLRPHYMEEHSSQIKMCEVCDLVFLTEKAIKLHILSNDHQQNVNRTGSNVAENYFTCHICKKKFNDEKYCKFHTAFKHFHLTTEDAVIAEFDGKDATRVQFKDYLDQIKSLKLNASVQCPECNKTYKKNNIIEHLRTHSGDKPFMCKICPKSFMSSVSLRRHLMSHFGCQEQTCKVCGKRFKKGCSYIAHMKIHTAQNGSVEKEHKCPECHVEFYFPHQVHAHMKRHRKREFVCQVPGCHWKFVFKNELDYHMKSHSNENPFLCDLCGYATKSKCRLKRHHKTHTGERNYHCEYCTYKAGNPTHLHRHMRIHIGSKPFKCPYCEYACNTQENLRKHIVQTKKHQGRYIYPCKFCEFGANKTTEFRQHIFEKHADKMGNDVHTPCLSGYTGLYDRSADPKKPEEGNQIFQVRERVHTGKSKKKKQKIKKSDNKDDDKHADEIAAMIGKYETESPEKKALVQNSFSEYKNETQPDTKNDMTVDDKSNFDYIVAGTAHNTMERSLNSSYISQSCNNPIGQTQLLDISRQNYPYRTDQGRVQNVFDTPSLHQLITIAPITRIPQVSVPHDPNTTSHSGTMPYHYSQSDGAKYSDSMQRQTQTACQSAENKYVKPKPGLFEEFQYQTKEEGETSLLVIDTS